MHKVDLTAIPRPQPRQIMSSSSKKMFDGSILSVYQWQQKMYDGSTATFEKLARKDSVGILAVTEDKKILLSQQEQPSLAPFTGLLGGVIDDGETPFETAQRELLEEAGVIAQRWDLWFTSQPHNKIDWAIYMFIAHGCRTIKEQQLDAGEKIKIVAVEYDQFLKAVFQPDFRDFEVTLRVARDQHTGNEEKMRSLILGE